MLVRETFVELEGVDEVETVAKRSLVAVPAVVVALDEIFVLRVIDVFNQVNAVTVCTPLTGYAQGAMLTQSDNLLNGF